MKFGVFDYINRKDEPLQRLYEQRLLFVEEADRLGFHGYHTAEHHWTPVNVAPVPGIFLAAAAARTRRIRLGPLIYQLPFYNPLRLSEEVCMLDHLSGGRFDLGVGRGASIFELAHFNVAAPATRAIFTEFFELLIATFTRDRVTHEGRHYQYYDVPIELKPLQLPWPPLWYGGANSDESRDYIARWGFNLIAGQGSTRGIQRSAEAYRAAWERHADSPMRAHLKGKKPSIGAARQVFVAETDAEADRIARPARDKWYEQLEWLTERNVHRGTFNTPDFDAAVKEGRVVVGAPATVRSEIARQVAETGIDYMVCQFAFGDLAHEQALRSLQLFAAEVTPHFAAEKVSA